MSPLSSLRRTLLDALAATQRLAATRRPMLHEDLALDAVPGVDALPREEPPALLNSAGAVRMTHAQSVLMMIGVIGFLEANLITPVLLGRRFTLNPVMIFISLIFWTWLWGVPGALLSVPFLVSIAAICDRVPSLSAISELLTT